MTESEIASKIIAEAFLHYPTMTYAFQGKPELERKKFVNRLFVRCVAASQRFGGIINLNDHSGSVIWLKGDFFPMGLLNELKSGMWKVPLEIGLSPTLCLIGHEADSETWIKQNSTGRMGYLWCIGVLEKFRGQGKSRELVTSTLEAMKLDGITECWLKTEDPKNVLVYTKLGFEMVRHIQVKNSNLPTWFFKKPIQ